MYGLEKDNKNKKPFEFDLEIELKGDPAKSKQLIKTTEERILELKNLLRQGASSADFDKLGVLLHGYSAFLKVINKFTRK